MNTEQKSYLGNHYVNLTIGVLGMLVTIYGNLVNDLFIQKLCYLSGGGLLFISSLLERHTFFTILQLIILSGTSIAFAPIDPLYKALLPIILIVLAIIYFIKQGYLTDRLTWFGCIGIIFLAAGYAITHPVIFFLGAILLAIYSFGVYRRGVAIGLLWGILNTIFALTALIAVYRLISG